MIAQGAIFYLNVEKKKQSCTLSTKQLYVWLMCLEALPSLYGKILTRPTGLYWYYHPSTGQLWLFSAPKGLVPCGTVCISVLRKDIFRSIPHALGLSDHLWVF